MSEEAPGPALLRSRISRLRVGLVRRQERRAEFSAVAAALESARQSRAAAAGLNFQMKQEIFRGSAWDSFQVVAFLSLSALFSLSLSPFFLAWARFPSSVLIFSSQFLFSALGSVISSLFAERQLLQAFRLVLALGLFLLPRWISSPLSLLRSGRAIPSVRPLHQFRHPTSFLLASPWQLGSATCPAWARRDALYAVFSVILRACVPHRC